MVTLSKTRRRKGKSGSKSQVKVQIPAKIQTNTVLLAGDQIFKTKYRIIFTNGPDEHIKKLLNINVANPAIMFM